MTLSRNATLRFDVKLHVLDATKLDRFSRNLPASTGRRFFGDESLKEAIREATEEIEKASDDRVRELDAYQATGPGPSSEGPDRIVGPLLVVAEASTIRLLYDASYGLADILHLKDQTMEQHVRTVIVWDGGIQPTVWSKAEVKEGRPSMDYGYHYDRRKAINTPSLEASYRESFNAQTADGYDADELNDWFFEHAAAIVLITKAAVAKNPEWVAMVTKAEGTTI
ncbi:hypothetical protein CGCSCA5_v014354 [Colletotrichum siamense]|nr:hypothetical protein CGCSCA5_v014354 [Colletotrichum siamense]KAF4860918.1 hypothetical protein CGCSCA1_v015026 [Colletotrichum siamense]